MKGIRDKGRAIEITLRAVRGETDRQIAASYGFTRSRVGQITRRVLNMALASRFGELTRDEITQRLCASAFQARRDRAFWDERLARLSEEITQSYETEQA